MIKRQVYFLSLQPNIKNLFLIYFDFNFEFNFVQSKPNILKPRQGCHHILEMLLKLLLNIEETSL